MPNGRHDESGQKGSKSNLLALVQHSKEHVVLEPLVSGHVPVLHVVLDPDREHNFVNLNVLYSVPLGVV